MPGLPADHVLTIIRIKQSQQERAGLATSRTIDYTRTGWKQRNHRTDRGQMWEEARAISSRILAACPA